MKDPFEEVSNILQLQTHITHTPFFMCWHNFKIIGFQHHFHFIGFIMLFISTAGQKIQLGPALFDKHSGVRKFQNFK